MCINLFNKLTNKNRIYITKSSLLYCRGLEEETELRNEDLDKAIIGRY